MNIVLAFVLSLAVVCDLRERRIPNALTLGGAVAALTLRLLIDPALVLNGLMGAAVGSVVAVTLFAIGAFGAGDGKLLIAVGAFLGLQGLPTALLATGAVGGIMTLIVSWQRGVFIPLLIRVKDLALWCITLGRAGTRWSLSDGAAITMPYGPAIAVGATLAWAIRPVLP
ncbi:MAG: A24 family peptidase [Gemmatimonadota bacterium]|jgi:prepilin peptidase CpaA